MSGLYGNSDYWPVIEGRERLFVFCPQSFFFFFRESKTQAKHVLKLRMKTNIREAHPDEFREAPVICPQLG